MAVLNGTYLFLYIGGVKVGKEISHNLNRQYNNIQKTGRILDREIIMTDKQGSLNLSVYVDYTAANSYSTIISGAESQGLLDFEIKTGVTDDPEITFSGYITQLQQASQDDNAVKIDLTITISGTFTVLLGGAFQAEADDTVKDQINVYSGDLGSFPYSLRNVSAGTTITGTLSFAAPAESGGFVDGLYKDEITGLISGTEYELTVAGTTTLTVITGFDIANANQEILPVTEPDFLTKTGINQYGLPYTVQPIAIDGTVNDVSGNANNGAIINSPAGTFVISDTLTFTASLPYTQPTTVTINEGTAAGSYTAGVFTISTAGTIESLTVDGVTVYICANIGNTQRWVQNSVQYEITFSSITWTTQNNNAFIQSKGGTVYKDVTVDATLLASDIETGTGDFEYVINANFLNQLFDNKQEIILIYKSSVEFIQLTTTAISFRASGGLDALALTPNQSLLESAENTITINRTSGNYTLTIENAQVGSPFVYNITGTNTGTDNIRCNNLAAYNLLQTPKLILNSFTLSKGSPLVLTHSYTPTTSNTDTVGGVNISSKDLQNGAIPTAFDSSGVSTGFDVIGNALPTGYGRRFFNFTESLQWKTDPPTTTTYASLPPPNVSTDEYAVEDTANESKYAFFYYETGASVNEDAEILKLQALADNPAPKKIIR